MAATRDVVVQTKLKEEFVFRHMHGREALSELFDYHVELLCEDDTIKLEDILGTPITLTMQLHDGGERIFMATWSSSYTPAPRAAMPATMRACGRGYGSSR